MKNLKRSVLCLLVFAAYVTASVDVQLENQHAAILQSSDRQISLGFVINDLEEQIINQDGNECSQFSLSGEGVHLRRSEPVVPMIARFVVVPPSAGVRLEVDTGEPRWIESRHPPVRCLDAKFTQTVEGDRSDELPVAEMSEPFVIRGVRLVKVSVYPVQYDTENGRYAVYDHVRTTLHFTDDNPINPVERPVRRHRSTEFKKLISALAVNGDEVGRDDPDRDVDPPYVGHYLVVTHENALEYAAPFIEWRRKAGYKVDIISITNDDCMETDFIKDQIQDLYDEYIDDGIDPFDQILLVGDRTQYNGGANPGWILEAPYGSSIWGNPQHADFEYACLEGGNNDFHPDAGFARFPAGSVNTLQLVVGRTLSYEAEPFMEDTEWFTRGAVYSQHWGLSEVSAWHLSIATNVRWAEEVLQYRGFDDIAVFEDLVWDEDAVRIGPWFVDQFNEGRNFMTGRAQLWNWRNDFNGVNDNVIFPINICTNGIGDWAAANMFRTGDGNHLRGAVLTTFAWGDTPTIPMSCTWLEMTNGIMNWDMSIGWARVLAVTAYEGYIPNFNWQGHPIYEHVKADIDCYGDPGIQPWLGVPRIVNATFPESITPHTNVIEISVTDDDQEEAVSGAQVTLYAPGDMPDFDEEEYADYNDMIMLTGKTGEDGLAQFTFTNDVEFESGTPMYMTVTGRDILPLFGEIDIVVPGIAISLADYDLRDIEGNDDGEVNPGERFAIDLQAVNIGNEGVARDVNAVLTSLSPYVEVEDAEVAFGDIEPDDFAEGDGPVTIIISETCPDYASRPATAPELAIDFTSGEESWTSIIRLNPVAPNFTVHEVVGGIMVPAGAHDLDVDLANIGGQDSPEFNAELQSVDIGIEVIEAVTEYPAIAAGEHEINGGAGFRINSNQLVVPGWRGKMRLILSTEEGFVDTTEFELQVEEPRENAPQGPDDYGYICFDNTDQDWGMAPEYDWIEISTQVENPDFEGTLIEFEGESPMNMGEAIVIPMPFDGQFYGVEFDSITVSTNGFLAIDNQPRVVNFQNWPLDRGIGGGVGMIAPFWDWLRLEEDESAVYWHYDEDMGQLIIEWYRLYHLDDDQRPLTFEVIIRDPEVWINVTGDSEILFQYQSIDNQIGPNDGRGGAEHERNNYWASVGISSPEGTTGLSYTWDNEYPVTSAPLEDETAILYTLSFFQGLGVLHGNVIDAESGDPIEDVLVFTSLAQSALTDENGDWFIENALSGVHFDLTVSKQGYNSVVMEDIILEADEDREFNFELLHPEFAPSVDRIIVELEHDLLYETPLTLLNEGNGPLEWSVSKRLCHGIPNDPWELRGSVPAGFILEDDHVEAAAYIDTRYYVAAGNDHCLSIFVLDRNGNILDSFLQPNLNDNRGIRDLTWDGELLWGAINDSVYGMTLDGDVVESFGGYRDVIPFRPITTLTYDPDREVLWMSGTTTNIYAITREGVRIDSLEIDREGLRIYGLAYWEDDPDGFPLYILNRDVEGNQIIHKCDPVSEELRFVTYLEPEIQGSPAGLFITDDFDIYSWVLMTVISAGQDSGGDRIDIWQLDANTGWFDIIPGSGVIDAGRELELVVVFDATNLPLEEFEGEFVFTHNAYDGETVIPVILDVVEDIGENADNALPVEFGIASVYPNPFNSQTRITFTLDGSSPASLNAYDLNGRLVAHLAADAIGAGSHQLVWDASELPTGVYLLRLESDSKTSTAKIALVK